MNINFIGRNNANFYGHWANRNGKQSVDYYNQKCLERRDKYEFQIDPEVKSYVEEVNKKGYCKIENYIDISVLEKLNGEFEDLIQDGSKLKQNSQSHIVASDPFLNTTAALELAFDDRLIKIATGFFNCIPGIGTFNLRKSLANNLPAEGTNLWHRDFNSPVKIIKFFFYLNDVDENNGPFSYVEESNNKMFNGWWLKHRWFDEELGQIYGNDKLKRLTAKKGDLLIATTNGWHKGEKLVSGTRSMLTINFLVHPELAGGVEQDESKRFKISQEDFNNLPDWKKPVADFLLKV
jgi:hypothetical protein